MRRPISSARPRAGSGKRKTPASPGNPSSTRSPCTRSGALAVSASDPKIVWAGTGEPLIRSNVSIGNGVWKSTDGGESWKHMGLEGTGRIGRMIVHPSNPDIVYAAALGHGYGPQPERGIYRTKDGGKSWERVLFVDEKTGASDLVMDPSNPADPLRRDVAARDQDVGAGERRPFERHLRVPRRRRYLDSSSRKRTSQAPRRKDRALHDPARFAPHLCAHRDRRRRSRGTARKPRAASSGAPTTAATGGRS